VLRSGKHTSGSVQPGPLNSVSNTDTDCDPDPDADADQQLSNRNGGLMTERSRSQVLGIIVLTALILAYACIRYYLRSG
jgi:hypothetical protein